MSRAVVRDDDHVGRHAANVAPAGPPIRRPFGESRPLGLLAVGLAVAVAATLALAGGAGAANGRGAWASPGWLRPAAVHAPGTSALAADARAARGTRYVAPGGTNYRDGRPKTCRSRRAPCRSLNRAFHAARPGNTILLAGGTYPDQTIGVDRGKVHARERVVFRPAPGANVVIDGTLTMRGSHATFAGSRRPYNFHVHVLSSDATEGRNASNHVTFRHLDGAYFSISAGSYIKIKGGDWGPADGAKGDDENKIGPNGSYIEQEPRHIVLAGVRIHDQQSSDLTNHHHGGLMLIGGGPMVIRNSKFLRNVVYDIEVGAFNGATNPHHVTLENNWFGTPVTGLGEQSGPPRDDGQAEVQLQIGEGGYRHWLVRFNSFHHGFAAGFNGPATPYRDFRVIANTGESQDCQPGIVYRWNVWSDGRCSRRERVSHRLPYVSLKVGHENYHLRRGTRAQNVVPRRALKPGSGLMLRRDIDHQKRPCGRRVDAGSDERC